MESSLPKDEKTKELILNTSFRPLLELLVESNPKTSCQELSNKLVLFQDISFEYIKNNNAQVCFENLRSMYSSTEIPLNIFWIASINNDPKGYDYNPFNFLEDLDRISHNIISNLFEKTHEWYFDHEGNSGVFLHFNKPVGQKSQFVSIFVAFKNGDGVQTLTEIKKGK